MDAESSSSIGSDHATHSRGRSVASRNSEHADTQSSRDTRSTHGITFNVPDGNEGGEVAYDPSLVSCESSEDPDV